ncbi:MAG: hypothetical protein HY881_07685 [Deltaproteobacteria bacterium]|nr:hypothetical protein [Deltaproteobacteria bacterium]
MFRSRSRLLLISILWISAVFLAGCAMPHIQSTQTSDGGTTESCADFFASLDQQTTEAGVMDSGAFRVKGYPYLRANRFLASFREWAMDRESFAAWVNHMQALDQESRGYEIANLPAMDAPALASASSKAELSANVVTCGNLLKAADFQDSGPRIEKLREQVVVPDEYSLLRRTLGVYPLFSVFVSLGVDNWHAEAKKNFSAQPPEDWSGIRYAPEKPGELPLSRQIIEKTRSDSLGIPAYAPEDLQALFRIYAPIWEVQTQNEHDKIGTPFWNPEGELGVNTGHPMTYTLPSFTHFGKDILTQLNYIVWFPSRPKANLLDIYGGLLDGINYRITLDKNGEPLLYETIHNCGCYYMAFPTKRLHVREKNDYAESPLILQTPEVNPISEFMTIALKSRTHAVQHLYPLARETQSESAIYSLADYGQLRSLPCHTDGRAGMFDQDGVGIGTERLERFILWPTGVLSPGSMRQWGRQAVAFIGIRHFDDPFFMDKIFMETDF